MIKLLKDKKVAIFDLDGTVINSMDYWSELDRKLILSMTGTTYEDDFQILWERKMEEYNNYPDPMVLYCAYLAEKYNINISGEMLLKKRDEMIVDIYRRDVVAKKGVKELIKRLYNDGIILVIATTTGRENVNACRDNEDVKELFDLFSAIYTYDDVEKRKPDPMVHKKIMEKFGVLPKECIIFEDSISGVMAANSVGIDVVVVKDELSVGIKDKLIQNSIRYIESFDELL